MYWKYYGTKGDMFRVIITFPTNFIKLKTMNLIGISIASFFKKKK